MLHGLLRSPFRRQRHNGLGFLSSTSVDTSTLPTVLAKRKLVFVLSYIGTRYHGLQKARTRPKGVPRGKETSPVTILPISTSGLGGDSSSTARRHVPTVEDELEKALLAVGCLKPENAGDLDRLGWSRIARTDKVKERLYIHRCS